MVRVILVTNFHPNETAVTSFYGEELCRRLIGRGHSVEMISIPDQVTLHGQAQEALRAGRSFLVPDLEEKTGVFVENLARKNPQAVVVDLHCRGIREEDMRNPGIYRRDRVEYPRQELKKPSKMPARSGSYFYNTPFPDSAGLEGGRSSFFVREGTRDQPNLFGIEVPAVLVRTPDVLKQFQPKILEHHSTPRLRDEGYFAYRADLKMTKASNILNSKNLDRIAHVLDTDIQTWTGRYRLPRGRPFIPRRYKIDRNRYPIRDSTMESGKRISPARRILRPR